MFWNNRRIRYQIKLKENWNIFDHGDYKKLLIFLPSWFSWLLIAPHFRYFKLIIISHAELYLELFENILLR